MNPYRVITLHYLKRVVTVALLLPVSYSAFSLRWILTNPALAFHYATPAEGCGYLAVYSAFVFLAYRAIRH